MEIVIDIPEEVLKSRQYCRYFGAWSEKLTETIENGTPLPKGHGRLIDADALEYALGASDRDIYVKCCLDEDAPTIIGADKEVGE